MKKSIFKVDSKIAPKSIKLINDSKLFDSNNSFSFNKMKKMNSTPKALNNKIGIELKSSLNSNKSSNSLVDYNSSDSDS